MNEQNHDGKVIIDDGLFYIQLNGNYPAETAPGFLKRRCAYALTTPGGFEIIGGFDQCLDSTWGADVSALYDEETDSDCKMLASKVSRLNAISRLWLGRHEGSTI